MAVVASDQVTLQRLATPRYIRTYYRLQASTLTPPAAPTTNPPASPWSTTEPNYTAGSTDTLYTVQLTVWGDDSFEYGPVQKSSSYEAAKQAYNAAQAASQTAATADGRVTVSANAPTTANGTGKPVGAVWFRKSGANFIGAWEWSGSAWQSRTFTDAVLASLDVAKLSAGTANIGSAVAQKIAAASGQFIELDVSQLVAVEGTIDEAVINELWADVVVAKMATAQQFIGENAIISGAITTEKLDAEAVTVEKVSSTFGRDLNLTSNGSIVLALGNAANGLDAANAAKGMAEAAGEGAYLASEQAAAAAAAAAEAISASENLGRYYRFGETDLRIGQPGSPVELSVAETGISFRQNDVAVSLWDGGQMIVKSFVGEEVVLANHKIETRGARTIVRSM